MCCCWTCCNCGTFGGSLGELGKYVWRSGLRICLNTNTRASAIVHTHAVYRSSLPSTSNVFMTFPTPQQKTSRGCLPDREVREVLLTTRCFGLGVADSKCQMGDRHVGVAPDMTSLLYQTLGLTNAVLAMAGLLPSQS